MKQAEGPSGPSPIFVRAMVKMIYGGKTIFPGNAMAVAPKLAEELIKKGMAEWGTAKERAVLEPEERR